MATSNSYDFSMDKAAIIKNALIEAGVIRDDQSVDGSMYAWGDVRLNTIIKYLQTKGLHLWKVKDVTLILEKDKQEYTLSGTGDRCSESVVRSVLTADAASAATTILLSTTNLSASQNIGVELSDGTMHWTTIASVDSTTELTLTDGLSGAASSAATVLAYTSLIPKPLRIYEAYSIIDGNEGNNIPIRIIPRQEYQLLNNKDTASYPIEVYFRPDLDHSNLKVWPVSCNNVNRIVMSAELPLDDMDNPTDTLSFPNWWYEGIHLSLAHAMARSYKQDRDTISMLEKDAMKAVMAAEDYGVEHTYIQIEPEID